MNFKDYLWFEAAGFMALLFRISRETGKSAKYFLSLILMAVFMSSFIGPAISEYLGLSVRVGSGLSGFLVLFGNIIIDAIEKNLPKKLKENINKL